MTSGPSAPNPPQLIDARPGVERRAARMISALTLLAGMTGLCTLVGALALQRFWQVLPGLLHTLTGESPLGLTEDRPVWVALSLLILTVLGGALAVWALWCVRQVIQAIRNQTLHPSPDHAEALAQGARSVRPWITLGQWTPVLLAVTNMVFSAAFLIVLRLALPQEADALNNLSGISFLLLITLISLVGNLPGILITWLTLAAVRRWLEAVVQRSQGQFLPVMPAARRLDPWLLLILVILLLLAAFTVFSALPLLVLPALGPELLSDPVWQEWGVTPGVLRSVTILLACLTVLSALLYGLLAALMAWSRGLAMNVAEVLDAQLPAPPTQHSPAGFLPTQW